MSSTVQAPGVETDAKTARIFFGLDRLSNAVAKLIGIKDYNFGLTTFNLADRGVANGIPRRQARDEIKRER